MGPSLVLLLLQLLLVDAEPSAVVVGNEDVDAQRFVDEFILPDTCRSSDLDDGMITARAIWADDDDVDENVLCSKFLAGI